VGAAGAVRGRRGGRYSIFNIQQGIFNFQGNSRTAIFDRITGLTGFTGLDPFVIPMFQHSNIPVFVFDRIDRIFQDLQDCGFHSWYSCDS
jgi:hypothetical protein